MTYGDGVGDVVGVRSNEYSMDLCGGIRGGVQHHFCVCYFAELYRCHDEIIESLVCGICMCMYVCRYV